MNNGLYFSQYESPNIVIVPTMSLNGPTSPKRRKIGNNIVVPIVNDVTYEKQKIEYQQENKTPDDSNKVDKNESNTSKNPAQSSWASNYLQSIGLDKKSSIWNHKIPRKNPPQKSVVTAEPSKKKITKSEVISSSECSSKTDIEKKYKLKIPNKIIKPNILRDSNTKTKDLVMTTKRSMIDGSKQSKQPKHESKRTISEENTSDLNKDKNRNILTCKNRTVFDDRNKIKKESIPKSKSQEQPINLSIFGRYTLPTTSKKNLDSKSLTKHSSLTHEKSYQHKPEKSKIKSVVKKQSHVRDNTKSEVINIKQNKKKSDNAKLSANYFTSNFKDKYKSLKSSITDVTSLKSGIKMKKKDNISDINKLAVSKKAQDNTKLKTRESHKKVNICDKIKSKENKRKNRTDLQRSKINIKSPTKRKVPKTTCRKIKLVINLICNNKPNISQCDENSDNESSSNESSNNENNNTSTTCTVQNMDLDFLNDIDIDEIVESLDTCDKKSIQYVQTDGDLNKYSSKENMNSNSVKSNICTGNNAQTDAIELMKILKGEEDDDIMRISIENTNEFLFRTDADNFTRDTESSQILENVSKSLMPIKIEEETSETLQTVSPDVTSNLNNVMISTNVSPLRIECTCSNINKTESAKETTILQPKESEPYCNDSQLPFANITNGTKPLETSSMETNNNENNITYCKIEKQMSSSSIRDTESLSILNNVATDANKKIILVQDKCRNMNQVKCEYSSTAKNTITKLNINQPGSRSADNINEEDQNKLIFKTIVETSNLNINVDKSILNCEDSAKLLKNELINKDNFSSNKSKQKNDSENILNEQKPETVITEHQKHTEKNNEGKACYNNEKNNKTIKDDKNGDNLIDYTGFNSVNQDNFLQHNYTEVNLGENGIKQNALVKNNNIVTEEAKSPGEEKQTDKGNQAENNDLEDSQEKKQKDLPHDFTATMGSQTYPYSEEITIDKIKSKEGRETVLKLEKQLFTCSGSKYSIISIIHTGRYSKIFKCKHPNGKYYALKMQTANTRFKQDKEKKQMMYSLTNDIPKNNLFIVYLAKAFNMAENWCFLMEYYPKNLDQVLTEIGKPFPIEHIQDYARQLVMAVMVLRNKNMVHLDIKPKHILINTSSKMLKLCGFDNLSYIDKIRILPSAGTVNYRAPEVILGYTANFEIDVWSTGLVLYEMAANQKLFPGKYNNDILYKQICTVGCVPYDMIKKSRHSNIHFVGSKFMRRSGFKGKDVNIISKFYKNNKLCDSIYNAYFEHWGHHRTISQQNCDIGKLSLFVKLLQKMLTMHPESRLPIEFIYANPFIYDAYSYQEW